MRHHIQVRAASIQDPTSRRLTWTDIPSRFCFAYSLISHHVGANPDTLDIKIAENFLADGECLLHKFIRPHKLTRNYVLPLTTVESSKLSPSHTSVRQIFLFYKEKLNGAFNRCRMFLTRQLHKASVRTAPVDTNQILSLCTGTNQTPYFYSSSFSR